MPFEHVNYFTAGSLDVLAEKYGLKRNKTSNLFQPIVKPADYIIPFLKNFVFGGFYPTGVFEADLVKVQDQNYYSAKEANVANATF